MSDYGAYLLKSAIVSSAESMTQHTINMLVKTNVIKFYLKDNSVVTGTTNATIAGKHPELNSETDFHLYDIDKKEWVTITYHKINAMNYVSSVD